MTLILWYAMYMRSVVQGAKMSKGILTSATVPTCLEVVVLSGTRLPAEGSTRVRQSIDCTGGIAEAKVWPLHRLRHGRVTFSWWTCPRARNHREVSVRTALYSRVPWSQYCRGFARQAISV